MAIQPPIPPSFFKTKRLLLRKPVQQDAKSGFDAYSSDPEVTRYLQFRTHETPEETNAFYKASIRDWSTGESNLYIMERQAAVGLIGGIHLYLTSRGVCVGYVLGQKYWNKGYMTEALSCVVDWALSQEMIYRVYGYCDVDHLASARVMAKAGMEFEGVLKRYSVHPNVSPEPRDSMIYAKTR